MIIRNATIDDVVQLKPLLAQLGYQLSHEELKECINTCLSTDVYNYLVSEIDGVIAGLCIFVIYPKFYKKANCCFLEILVVLERFRKQGVGAKLVMSMEDIARSSQCSSISLLSNLGRDKKVHDFYRNKGYLNEGQKAQLYLR